MSKGLSSLEHLIGRLQNQTATILNNEKDEEKKRKYEKLAFELMFEDKAIIEKELKDYQEIKEIAKHYNWDDITSEIFNVKTDKKYRDLFNSAIVNIQEDYRKARALEIIKKKGILVNGLIKSKSLAEYNALCNYHGMTEWLIQEEYDLLKEVLL